MPVLLAHAIEDSIDIFGISGGFEHPKTPPRYATDMQHMVLSLSMRVLGGLSVHSLSEN